jgi:hypothetical protein
LFVRVRARQTLTGDHVVVQHEEKFALGSSGAGHTCCGLALVGLGNDLDLWRLPSKVLAHRLSAVARAVIDDDDFEDGRVVNVRLNDSGQPIGATERWDDYAHCQRQLRFGRQLALLFVIGRIERMLFGAGISTQMS